MNSLARFEKGVLPHLDAAYNLARWLTRNDHDAQDVVQEALIRAFRFHEMKTAGNPRAWLLAIVRNSAWTWLEKNRPAEVVAIEDAPVAAAEAEALTPASHDANPEVILMQSAQAKLVNQALEELPAAFREVLVLRELEDLSYKEIASVVCVPVGTVMSRLARAREQLRRAIVARMKKAS
jgi:RNA polymerase sigma-70 factor (ECF subfamily)